jgi:hypothetical protein
MREKKENNYGIRGIRGRNETAKGLMTTTNHASRQKSGKRLQLRKTRNAQEIKQDKTLITK